MIAPLLAFEWRYHTRQLAFYLGLIVACGLSLVMVSTGYGPANLWLNSPWSVAQSLGLLSLAGIFVVTVLSASTALRDTEHRMREIVLATPVSKWTWLLTRLGGVILASAGIFLLATITLMLAPFVIADPATLGPVRIAPYLSGYLVIVLPNIVFTATLLFAVALGTRSTLATWVGGVVIYCLYWMVAMLVESPMMAGSAPQSAESMMRAAMADPLGLSAFYEQTRYWTADQRNTQLLSLRGSLLWNRALWLLVSAGLAWLCGRLVRMRSTTRARPVKLVAPEIAAPAAPRWTAARQLAPAGRFSWRTVRSGLRMDLRHAFGSKASIALAVIWLFLIGMEATSSTTGEYRSHLYPTTALMLDVIAAPLARIGGFVIIFFASELTWRARSSRFDEILDATPAPSAVWYVAHFITLAAVATALAVGAMVVTIGVQLASGYSSLEPAAYATLLWTGVPPLLLVAVMALLVQALSPNRYVGMIIALALLLASQSTAIPLFENPLTRYGAVPEVVWTGMAGLGNGAASYAWLILYWSLVALVLAMVTVGLWRRGRHALLQRRLALVPARLGQRGIATAGALILAAALTGGWIAWRSSIPEPPMSRAARQEWRAEYERTYRTRVGIQPAVASITANVALFPRKLGFNSMGTLVLRNGDRLPIDTVWVSVRREAQKLALTLDGIAPVVRDVRFGMYAFVPARPLAPGDSARLTWSMLVREPRIQLDGIDEEIAPRATFLPNVRVFPQVGYRSTYQVNDPVVRRQLGLGPLATDTVATSWVRTDITLSTSAGQTVVAPGALVRRWKDGDREYFEYRHAHPVVDRFALASAAYEVARDSADGVLIEVYYHAGHDINVPRMIQAARTSLRLFTEAYGPYPLDHLRIVEVPGTFQQGAAIAYPGTIFFVEDRGFLTDARDSSRMDIVTRRVAHEVAHQWWGMQLSPANAPGASVLVESFAKYGEQRVLEKVHSRSMVDELMYWDEDRYLRGRTETVDEPPLARAENEDWLYYGKGAVVMNALGQEVGTTALDRSMRQLLEQQGGPAGKATTGKWVALLVQQADSQQQRLIREWVDQVVVYDLAIPAAKAEGQADGSYLVRLELKASRISGSGNVESAPLNEPVELVVRGEAGDVLWSGMPSWSGTDTTITVPVKGKPARAELDPHVLRLDANRFDNGRAVKAQP